VVEHLRAERAILEEDVAHLAYGACDGDELGGQSDLRLDHPILHRVDPTGERVDPAVQIRELCADLLHLRVEAFMSERMSFSTSSVGSFIAASRAG
jgi:hypothetical protein